MVLLSDSNFIIKGGQILFEADAGVPPYSYAVIAGGGSIHPSTGLYTAGNDVETVTIEATDSAGTPVVLTKDISVLGHLELFCGIIREEMGLADDQVYIYNQKLFIPKDDRLYIAVSVGSVSPFGVHNTFDHNTNESVQFANFKSSLEINILSKSRKALDRKEEVLIALHSDFSKNMQTLNGFHIALLSSQFTNLSELEGVTLPFRFNISVNIQYAITKRSIVNYFDTFNDTTIIGDK